ncbi:MAG: formate acetyltransferase, partial [Clostridia bacterium]|nr:formate acetyltransferase [Clostridia bacterium]
MIDFEQWQGFHEGSWKREINVADFIKQNYTPYDGNEDFLAPPTNDTQKLWDMLQKLQKEERRKGGVLDMDGDVVSTLTSHAPGYLDKSREKIVGLQTDKP